MEPRLLSACSAQRIDCSLARWRLTIGLLLAVSFGTSPAASNAASPTQTDSASPARPNILLILADDLGFSDLGCYGGEIATPHLDSLAANGLRYSQFYNTGRCWPTRGSLMTGYYAQSIRRDKLPAVRASGNQGQRPSWAPLLPKLLATVGYRSYHTGKWHIDSMPLIEGFDHSYYLADQGRYFNPQRHFRDDVKLPPVARGTDYYATTSLADHVIETLQQHDQDSSEHPFFYYLAFAAPHFPLHALPEDIELYKSVYRAGWDEIRSRRWQRQKSLKLFDDGSVTAISSVERDLGPPYDFPNALQILGDDEINRPLPWDSLNESQQTFQATKMAIHAAMIHRMDIEIGRVFEQIKRMNQWDNTLVMFLSDNGASAEIMVRDDGHDVHADPGSAATYLCLGPGWSTVCNTPFRRHKTWTHEGGISTPMIVAWPKGIAARSALCRQEQHVIDVFPTILDITGAERPSGGPQAPGVSMLSQWRGEAAESPTANDRKNLWWYHDGHKALRSGDWKALADARAPDDWELYNLAVDRAESNNMADMKPKLLESLVDQWNQQLAVCTKRATADLKANRPNKKKRNND